MNPIAEEILMHYGMPRRSGRYPWGSGENPYQHSGDFLSRIDELKSQGMSDTEIAKAMGLTTTQYRTQKSLAKDERRALDVARAKSLREDGLSLNEIAKEMGFANDSSVRSLLNENCVDGRTIKKDAFKNQNGKTVPLVWGHTHSDPNRVLGHAVLENRDEGVYAYCSFNDSESGLAAKKLVKHGDVRSLSICAGQLKQAGANVVHGVIYESQRWERSIGLYFVMFQKMNWLLLNYSRMLNI